MSNDKKKNGTDSSDKLSALRLHRRRFLQALGLLGGGALAHTGPMIAAAGAASTGSGNVFDISLPARYDVDEPKEVINIALEGRPTVPVDFHTVSNVALDPTSDPDVATVRLVSFQMTSNDPNPLKGVGVDTGAIKATVPSNTVIGQLDLASGTLVEHAFPITVSFERNRESFDSLVNPSKPVVTETPKPEDPPERKCNKRNDVDLEISTPFETGTGFGTINLGMAPSVQTTEPKAVAG